MKSRRGLAREPRHDIGRAALPHRLDIKAVRQHKPTANSFMGTKSVRFRKGVYPLTLRMVRGIHAASGWYLRRRSNCSDAFGRADAEAE